jgi:protease II
LRIGFHFPWRNTVTRQLAHIFCTVAKLREVKTNDTPVLLKTEMTAGHAGPSGRYDRLRDTAFEYAFLLDHLRAS